MLGVKPRTPTADVLDNLNMMKVNDLNVFPIAQVTCHTADVITVFRRMLIVNRIIPTHVASQSDQFNIPLYYKSIGKYICREAVIWNNVLKVGSHWSAQKSY